MNSLENLLSNKVQNVQVSDTTGDATSTEAGLQKFHLQTTSIKPK
jgi:hypothetical protein